MTVLGRVMLTGMFSKFCEVITSSIDEYIVWPEGNQLERTVHGFEVLRANTFPGVIGSIDGSYV